MTIHISEQQTPLSSPVLQRPLVHKTFLDFPMGLLVEKTFEDFSYPVTSHDEIKIGFDRVQALVLIPWKLRPKQRRRKNLSFHICSFSYLK